MIRGWKPTCLMLMALGLAACGRHNQPPSPAADNTTATKAPAEAAAPVDGSPQIAMAPDNVHLEYRAWGNADPAIVLIHGWACDANYWSNQIDFLKSKYTVVAVDLAGHGASTKNRTDWSMGNYGEDVATIVRQIHAPHVILVGHSMGGDVALEAARRIGDRVIGIIAVESLRSIGQPPMPKHQIDGILAPFKANFVGQTRKFVAESLFPRNAAQGLVQKIAYDMSLEPPEVAIPSMEALLSMDLAPTLADLHVPIYVINSDIGATDQARIRKTYPDFHLDVLDHTSHFLMMEAPARFNPVLQKDIDALVSQAAHR